VGGTRSKRIDWELSRHQRERERSGLVLSVLGQPDLEAADFARWASARGERVVPVEAGSLDAALHTILAHLPVASLQRAARGALASADGRSPDEIEGALAARSSGERMAWLAELAAGRPPLVAAGWALASLADGAGLDVTAGLLPLERLVPALVALADPIAVLVVPVMPANVGSLAQATVIAAGLCELLRPRAVALTAARSGLDELATVAGDRASIALARQGLIEVAASGQQDVPIGGRSHAERALLAALDRDRRTRGRFALSHKLGILFNGQDTEVDLYDAELELAVEIDGWHHFREPDGYRRDRAKDLLLQRAGILVLRVLEQDVWNRLDYLVEHVASAIADRHRTRAASRSQHLQ
jgi:very-short-patch-repair endonuclease